MSLALVDKNLKQIINKGFVKSDVDLLPFVQTSSIDMPSGSIAHLVKQQFTPIVRDIDYIIKQLSIQSTDLRHGALFLKGRTYAIPIGIVDIPKEYFGRFSPKSSIGRIDTLVRAIVDQNGLYDTIAQGTKGNVWIEVSPQSFNIYTKSLIPLNQLRFFDSREKQKPQLNNYVLLYDKNGVPLEPVFYEDTDKMILTLDLTPNTLVGYEALPTEEIVDLERRDLPWQKFFKAIKTNSRGKITIEKDKFYILMTKEHIAVHPELSIEMIPSSHLLGELRAHYAGFFDPNFGMPHGSVGVLEIRPHETRTVYDGQPICMIEAFKNKTVPDNLYGSLGNNYQYQSGPCLAKFFK